MEGNALVDAVSQVCMRLGKVAIFKGNRIEWILLGAIDKEKLRVVNHQFKKKYKKSEDILKTDDKM